MKRYFVILRTKGLPVFTNAVVFDDCGDIKYKDSANHWDIVLAEEVDEVKLMTDEDIHRALGGDDRCNDRVNIDGESEYRRKTPYGYSPA